MGIMLEYIFEILNKKKRVKILVSKFYMCTYINMSFKFGEGKREEDI